jgi:NADP-dependent 3-hydroxy acid dehydrogenase YdfG
VGNPANEIIQASSDVGFAAAKALANASNTFQVILAGRSLSKGNAVKPNIEAGGIKGIFSAIQFDVTAEVSVSEAVVHV